MNVCAAAGGLVYLQRVRWLFAYSPIPSSVHQHITCGEMGRTGLRAHTVRTHLSLLTALASVQRRGPKFTSFTMMVYWWRKHAHCEKLILYMPLQQFEIALNSTNGLKWAIVGQPSLKARPNVAWMTTWCHNIFKHSHIWTTCRAYISTVTTINYFENWISNTNMTIVIIIGKSEDKHISFFQCFVIGLKVIGIILELVFSNSLDFRQILTFY